jgi:hypothetical protein
MWLHFQFIVVATTLLSTTPKCHVSAFSPPSTSIVCQTTSTSTSLSLSSFPEDTESSLILPTTPELTRRDAFTAAAQASAIATLSSGWILPQTSSLAEAPLPQVPTVQLGTLKITRTIQGQWQLAGGHGRISESQALENMKAHLDAGISTLDTADIYGPSELIVGKFVKSQPKEAIPCTKFCCFRYLEEINRAEVRLRIQKVSDARNGKKRVFLYIVFMVLSINCIGM